MTVAPTVFRSKPELTSVFFDPEKARRNSRGVWKAVVKTGCIVTHYKLSLDLHPTDKPAAQREARRLLRTLVRDWKDQSKKS